MTMDNRMLFYFGSIAGCQGLWKHLPSLAVACPDGEHPWQRAITCWQLTACASVAELITDIADIIPTVPNAAMATTIANVAVDLIRKL